MARKNPNGFGSVYKVKGNRRKPWIARKTLGWSDGKQVKKTIGYYETKALAMEALINFCYDKYDSITIEHLYKEWSELHLKNKSKSTAFNSRSAYNQHICKIKDEKIKYLKFKEFQDFYDSLDVSTATAKQILSVLKMMFDYAVRSEYVEKNYVPFVITRTAQKVFEREIYSDEEIQKLIEHSKVEPFVMTILSMIYSGLRISEFLELKKEDVNCEESYLIVKKSKTEAGQNRLVPLHNMLVPYFESACKDSKDTDYLFSKNGKKDYRAYREKFIQINDKLGMKHRIHDCRHTFASLMSNADANKVAITKIIGHNNYAVTEKIYTHKDIKELKKQVNKI